MTIAEVRKHKDYISAMEKVHNYRKGFKFTIDFANIPKAKANALRILLEDACNDGILESIAIGLDINGNFVDETYIRL